MINNKKIALVLGGGATLGFSHIGVLKLFEELNIIPDIITGTSAGALIGGAYASGMRVEHLLKEIEKFNRNKIFDLKIIPFFGDSILQSNKINSYMQEIFGNKKIENASIKFSATAVNITRGELKYFKRGYFWEAVRASISVPAIFTPYQIGNYKYIDGGVMDNVPTQIAYEMGADIVIAINCINYENAMVETKTGIHSLMNALTLSQKELMNLKSKADLFINLNIENVGVYDFKKEDILSAIEQGYNQCKKFTNKILNLIENK